MKPQNTARQWAMGLLLFNLIVFIGVLIAQKNGITHPALDFIKAFSEAACIGALADWFAVIALFRHPLGIPLPHTAILPAKQAQLAQGVAKFIGAHFLDPNVIADQLARLHVGERLHLYAEQKFTDEVITQRLPQILQALMCKVPIEAPERLLVWTRDSMTQYLTGDRLGRAASRLIHVAQEQNLDKRLVNALAASLHEFVTQENATEIIRPWLNDLIDAAQKNDASWWDKIKNQVTGQAIEWVDDWIIEKVLAWIADFTDKIQNDDTHLVHLWAAKHIYGWRNQLFYDTKWHDWLSMYVHQWLRSPMANELVAAIWHKTKIWLNETTQNDSPWIKPLAYKIREVTLGFMGDVTQQAKLTQQSAQIAANLLTEHQTDIRDWLTAQMNAWSKERLTLALENAIGSDLQYIRINGTLIGGLIGLILHGVERLI